MKTYIIIILITLSIFIISGCEENYGHQDYGIQLPEGNYTTENSCYVDKLKVMNNECVCYDIFNSSNNISFEQRNDESLNRENINYEAMKYMIRTADKWDCQCIDIMQEEKHCEEYRKYETDSISYIIRNYERYDYIEKNASKIIIW
jgi:hypothetical protein